MRLLVPLAAFALVALAAYAPYPSPAVSPSPVSADSTEWQNLQVLPDSLTRDELIGIMRGFSLSLGVRCDHCHAGGDEGIDFPSDANPHKDVARGMMRMTWQINQEILPAIDGLHGEGEERRVTCFTCHRGATRPETSPPEPERRGSRPEPEPEHDDGDHDHGDGAHDHGDG